MSPASKIKLCHRNSGLSFQPDSAASVLRGTSIRSGCLGLGLSLVLDSVLGLGMGMGLGRAWLGLSIKLRLQVGQVGSVVGCGSSPRCPPPQSPTETETLLRLLIAQQNVTLPQPHKSRHRNNVLLRPGA